MSFRILQGQLRNIDVSAISVLSRFFPELCDPEVGTSNGVADFHELRWLP